MPLPTHGSVKARKGDRHERQDVHETRCPQVPTGSHTGVGDIVTLPAPTLPHMERAQNILSNTECDLSYPTPQP